MLCGHIPPCHLRKSTELCKIVKGAEFAACRKLGLVQLDGGEGVWQLLELLIHGLPGAYKGINAAWQGL